MSGKDLIRLLVLVLFLNCSLFNFFLSGNDDFTVIIENIKTCFKTSNPSLLEAYLLEGKRIYSDWTDVFDSKGYFSKSQVVLSARKFFENYDVITITTADSAVKELAPDKILVNMQIRYSRKSSTSYININTYIFFEKQLQQDNKYHWYITQIKVVK